VPSTRNACSYGLTWAPSRSGRTALADAEIVLQVEAGIDHRIRDRRIANPPREVARQARRVRRQAVEREGAEVVRVEVRVPRPAVDDDAPAERVVSADVIEIRRERHRCGVSLAGHLRAARRERVEHLNRRRFERRGLIAVRASDAQARVHEHPPLERPAVQDANVRGAVRRVVRALQLVVRADAEVIDRVV
jgi:hypothetical protein